MPVIKIEVPTGTAPLSSYPGFSDVVFQRTSYVSGNDIYHRILPKGMSKEQIKATEEYTKAKLQELRLPVTVQEVDELSSMFGSFGMGTRRNTRRNRRNNRKNTRRGRRNNRKNNRK